MAAILRLPRGVIGLRRDWLTTFDAAAYIEAARWNHHVWTPLGTGTPIVTPTIWPCVEALALLARMGVPVEEISRLAVIIPIFLACFSMYTLAFRGAKTSPIAAFAAGMVYGGGPVLFNKIVAGHIPYAIGYALLPLVLAGFLGAIRSHGFQSLAVLAVTIVAAMICSNGEQFLLLVPLAVLGLAILSPSPRALLYAVVIVLAVAAFQATSIVGVLTQGHQIASNSLFFPQEWIRENSVGFPHALILSGYQPGYWDSALGQRPWLFIDSLLALFPIVVVAIENQKRRWAITAAALFLLGSMILAGVQDNLAAPLLNQIFLHFTPALVFKELYNFAAVPSIGFALLVALGLDAVLEPALFRPSSLRMVIFALIGSAMVALYSSFGLVLWGVGLAGAVIFKSMTKVSQFKVFACVCAGLAVTAYTFPTFFSGNFGGQLQSTPIPQNDLRTARKLAAMPGWHRTLFLPAVQPLVIDGGMYGGVDPFVNGPGRLVVDSFPSGPVATALTDLQFDRSAEAVAVLRSLGVRFISDRPDFHSLFLSFEPSTAEAVYRWNEHSPIAGLSSIDPRLGVRDYKGPGVVRRTFDLGSTAKVLDWSDAAALPAQPSAAALILERHPGTLLLQGVQGDVPDPVLTAYSDTVAAPSIKNEVSLVTRRLGVDPIQEWTATSQRWFQDPELAGLSGIFTQSSQPFETNFIVPGTSRYQLWIAALAWGRGGIIDASIDHKPLTRLLTNSNSTSVRGFTLPALQLQGGQHSLTLTPEFGSAESEAVVAVTLRPPRNPNLYAPKRVFLDILNPEDAILAGRNVGAASSPRADTFVFQRLTALPGASQSMTQLHIRARRQSYLLHGNLPAKAGDAILTIASTNRLGAPLRLAVWSHRLHYPLVLRLLPPHKGVARIPLRVRASDLPLEIFFYGDATTTPNDDNVSEISLQSVLPAQVRIPHRQRSAAPVACSWDNPAHAQCRLSSSRGSIVEVKESYNVAWRLCIRSRNGECTDVPASKHFLGQGYDNAWAIPGAKMLEFEIYYAPDRYFAPAYVAQIWAIALCVALSIAAVALSWKSEPSRNLAALGER